MSAAARRRAATGGLQLVFVASAISATHQIIIPASAQAGDLAVLLQGAGTGGGSVPTDVVPTGWTGVSSSVGSNSTFGFRVRASYKILVGGDPGATITAMNGSAGDGNVMFVFRPSQPISSVVEGTWNTPVMTSSQPAQQTVSAAPSAPAITFGLTFGNQSSDTQEYPTQSPAFDLEVDSAPSSYCLLGGYLLQNTTPVSMNIRPNDAGAQGFTSGYVYVT